MTGRLGHLLAAEIDHPIVEPVLGEGLAVGALRLGDLVLVMREDQVTASAVDVEGLT